MVTPAGARNRTIEPLMSIKDFFALSYKGFAFYRVVNNAQHRKRLAFLGDSVLKTQVIKVLFAKEGLCCHDLCVQTDTYVANASLAKVFDRLQFPEAIRATHKVLLMQHWYSTHTKGTFVEALLGATALVAPDQTCEVVGKIMAMFEEQKLDVEAPDEAAAEQKAETDKLLNPATVSKQTQAPCIHLCKSKPCVLVSVCSEAKTAPRGSMRSTQSKVKAGAVMSTTEASCKKATRASAQAVSATQLEHPPAPVQFSKNKNQEISSCQAERQGMLRCKKKNLQEKVTAVYMLICCILHLTVKVGGL